MDYKEETLKTYNKFANYFDEKFEEYKNNFIKEELEQINSLFPKKSKILDLGSGPGNHALFFKDKGHEVLCLDISEEFLEICRKKGLATIKADFEKLSLPKNNFDVVWAYTSLLHTPKSKIQKIIIDIHQTLKENGLFVISLKEGKSEGFVDFKDGTKRWFSFYTEEEIKSLLKDFKIVESWKNKTRSDAVFLDYICRKNKLPKYL